MEMRPPLKPGSTIRMPNGGRYMIEEKIGEGGLSLVYAARTKGNGYPVIIKEFFPSEHAYRASATQKDADGTVLVRKDQVCPDPRYRDRFARCLQAFEQEGQLGSRARQANMQVIAFSDCGDGYAVLPRWSRDSCSLRDLVNSWRSAPPPSPDPVFRDLGRVRFALVVAKSLLGVLASLHGQGILHLDLSPSNVLWAGDSQQAGSGSGMVFLSDFGCSVLMTNGSYPVEYMLSYSREFAAPEYQRKDSRLTPASDIYSVGRLLLFLCRGQRAFAAHTNLQAEVRHLNLSDRHRQMLQSLLLRATAPQAQDRYQSAAEMQAATEELLEALPLHAINPDNSAAFTLYSLRSLLEGARDTHYSWAQELCDRRGVCPQMPFFPVLDPVASVPENHFSDDRAFLKAVLPDFLFLYLMEQISREADPDLRLRQIMAGNYPAAWKAELIRKLSNYGLDKLLSRCRSLLYYKQAFRENIRLLSRIPGEDIAYFTRCYTDCISVISSAPHKGLALLVIFALLGPGPDGFDSFCHHSPSEMCRALSA